MSLSLAPAHLKRYAEIARLLVKYGRGPLISDLRRDLPSQREARDARDAEPGSGTPGGARRRPREARARRSSSSASSCRRAPTCSRPPYLEALARLQDNVEPFPFMRGRGRSSQRSSASASRRRSRSSSRAARRRLARPGAPRGAARRAPGRGQGAAAGHPRADRRGPRGARARSPRFLDRHTSMGARYELARMVEEFRKTLLRGARLPAARRRTCVTLGENLEALRAHRRAAARSTTTRTSRVLTMDYVARREDHRARARCARSTSTARRSPTSSSAPTCIRS